MGVSVCACACTCEKARVCVVCAGGATATPGWSCSRGSHLQVLPRVLRPRDRLRVVHLEEARLRERAAVGLEEAEHLLDLVVRERLALVARFRKRLQLAHAPLAVAVHVEVRKLHLQRRQQRRAQLLALDQRRLLLRGLALRLGGGLAVLLAAHAVHAGGGPGSGAWQLRVDPGNAVRGGAHVHLAMQDLGGVSLR